MSARADEQHAVDEIMARAEIQKAARLARAAGFEVLEIEEGVFSAVHRTTGSGYYDLLIQWDDGEMEGVRQEARGRLWTPGHCRSRADSFVWSTSGSTLAVVEALLALDDDA